MKVTDAHLMAVIHDFPGQTDTLIQLFRYDKTFQLICDDYQKCTKALRHWSHSGLAVAPQRRTEYQELLAELKDEISSILKNKDLKILKFNENLS